MVDYLNKYKKASIKGDLIQDTYSIFDQLIRLLYQAQKAIEQKNYEEKYKILIFVEKIMYSLKLIYSAKEIDPKISEFFSFIITIINDVNSFKLGSKELGLVIDIITKLSRALKSK